MSTSDYNASFTVAMRTKIADDHKGITYDIPLITEAIKTACEDLAPKDHRAWVEESDTQLEYLISSVRNFRNTAACLLKGSSHNEEQIRKTIKNLRHILKQIIVEAGLLYDIDMDVVELRVRDTNHKLDQIIHEIFEDFSDSNSSNSNSDSDSSSESE